MSANNRVQHGTNHDLADDVSLHSLKLCAYAWPRESAQYSYGTSAASGIRDRHALNWQGGMEEEAEAVTSIQSDEALRGGLPREMMQTTRVVAAGDGDGGDEDVVGDAAMHDTAGSHVSGIISTLLFETYKVRRGAQFPLRWASTLRAA